MRFNKTKIGDRVLVGINDSNVEANYINKNKEGGFNVLYSDNIYTVTTYSRLYKYYDRKLYNDAVKELCKQKNISLVDLRTRRYMPIPLIKFAFRYILRNKHGMLNGEIATEEYIIMNKKINKATISYSLSNLSKEEALEYIEFFDSIV